MKILNWFFTFILGEKKNNWLSVRFHQYYNAKIDAFNIGWKKESQSNEMIELVGVTHFFDVPGGGQLALGENCHGFAGNVVGFSIGASWGKYGFCGGTMGRNEAKRMAEIILKQINECNESEEEELIRWKEWQRLF